MKKNFFAGMSNQNSNEYGGKIAEEYGRMFLGFQNNQQLDLSLESAKKEELREFDDTGVDTRELGEEIADRLALAREFHTYEGNERRNMLACGRLAESLHDQPLLGQPKIADRELFRKRAQLMPLLSDIGKTGPVNATPTQQEAFLRLYSFTGIPDFRTVTIGQFLERAAKSGHNGQMLTTEEAEGMRHSFEELNVSLNQTLEQFYTLHSEWTYDIVRPAFRGSLNPVLDKSVAEALSAHHIYRGVNPSGNRALENTVAEGGWYNKENFETVALQRINMITDVYEALMTRGEREKGNTPLTHVQAIGLTKKILGNQLCQDILVQRLLADINIHGSDLFSGKSLSAKAA